MARNDLIPRRRTLSDLRPLIDWPESLLGDVFRAFGEPFGEPGQFMMHIEEYVEDGTTVIRAELPGIDPEKDVDITVKDGMLTIHAQRRESAKTEDKTGYRSEFRYGQFVRSVMLPVGTLEDDVKATYHDGVLEIRLPVAAATPERKIAIHRT